MTDGAARATRYSDLGPRVASGLVLALIAGVDVWLGGPWIAGLAAVALVLMLWEYHRMVTGDGRWSAPALLAMAVLGIAAVIATALWGLVAGFACLAVGGLAVIVLGRRWAAWLVAGYSYMGGAMCAIVAIRGSGPTGAMLIFWLVLIVIAADVGAYFVGRRVGGRKLWPRVSPGKTWSGAIGGLAAAAVTGLVVALAARWPAVPVAVLSLGLAVASQGGDLLESAVKRTFGVKDASHLIPGHGGVMDRLDALIGAVWAYLVLGGLGLTHVTG